MKRPAFQFYPADWKKDANLQGCSLAARGLWVEIMCIAHQCETYGHLVVNGHPMTDMQICRLAGATPAELKRLVAELEQANVFSRAPSGAIYSRRMVRDEQLRNARADGGKAGAEHGAKGAEHGLKGGRPRKVKGSKKPPLNPPPSSSSSTSVDTPLTPQGGKVAFAPPEWVPIEAWTAWLEVRRKKRVPNTDEALRLSVMDLERLREAGHDPRAVIEQSVKRGWQGLFELKADQASLLSLPSVSVKAEACPCGAPGTVKAGGRWRCSAHVRTDFSTAARAA